MGWDSYFVFLKKNAPTNGAESQGGAGEAYHGGAAARPRGHARSDVQLWKRLAGALYPVNASSGCATASWMKAQNPPA